MTNLTGWAIALIAIAAVITGCLFILFVLRQWAKSEYNRIKKNPVTECDIDKFVGTDYKLSPLKCVALYRFQLGFRKASLEKIPLEVEPSPHVEGMWVARKSGGSKKSDKAQSVDQFLSENASKTPVVIATIRMGFGHHRLAYSAASWAIDNGHPTIFHDMLNIESSEADLVKDTDEMYSKLSRLASEIGGPVERLWGSMTLAGDADALRVSALMAAHLQPLLLNYPKDTPIITSHQLCALTASAAGFTNVVNLVVDNHPQWFLTVPNAVNMVQGPVNYQTYLRMGVQNKELKLAGHWCPVQLVHNIETDCERRIKRHKAGKPVRFLIPVGGAGAQRTFIIKFVETLASLVKDGKVQLFLNAGDHEHMKTAFLQVLDKCGLDFETVTTTDGTRNFQDRLTDGRAEPKKSVTLFAYEEYFPAVACTDILSRVSDVLAVKPSELAFYCIPRLHIRRVGDHELDSALRAAELGDGTLEAREVEDAMDYVNLFLEGTDLLESMNEAILRNHKIGIYDGCKNAVDCVLDMAKKD